jgi:2-hydroxycyclohexanecarboxyl-CoA dehydrogenase
MAGEAAYAAAKGGVIALTKSLAQEMARYRVRVNCLCPGPTRTRVLEENLGAQEVEKMLRRIPLKRAAEPEEIAEAVLFLASDAAAMITGQVLSVSGGLTMV